LLRLLVRANLRAHLKRLPDFDDVVAEDRALAMVRQHADFHRAFWRATRNSMATITGC
jgi:DNA-binding GntR family transcriptional regulator